MTEHRLGNVKGKLKLKIPRDNMIDIIEKSVQKLNHKQRVEPSIRNAFQKVGQDPFVDCSTKFRTHLDSLKQDSMYKTLIDNQTAEDLEP